ncbi:hypothetical protein E2C01_088837 [Portunus trituberculatus]|uniref:Uncharacterized protein n=1 Tax=Portunus trituberculatus TaxID=210409 RepID=A0A5B7JKN2_PORTR|nr:hypothetical protein [Portunus trituberculatus]
MTRVKAPKIPPQHLQSTQNTIPALQINQNTTSTPNPTPNHQFSPVDYTNNTSTTPHQSLTLRKPPITTSLATTPPAGPGSWAGSKRFI